jgi:2-haloacid dehalogenase
MKYKLFLIDLDDTLLDFQASEELCFKLAFKNFKQHEDLNNIHKTYKEINSKLWNLVEKGEVDKDFLKIERFRHTLYHHSLSISPQEIAEFYLDLLPDNIVLIDGALELCQTLKKHGKICIMTNGIESTQRLRIKKSVLRNTIDFLCVSEECGFAKPDSRFFEYTLNKIDHSNKEDVLMIGDRIETDILGAHNFGLDSLWFNKLNLPQHETIMPTFISRNLREIPCILGLT